METIPKEAKVVIIGGLGFYNLPILPIAIVIREEIAPLNCL